MKQTLDLADVQGLVVRGYGELPHAAYLLYSIQDAAGARGLLGQWAEEVPSAAEKAKTSALHVAFTARGLHAIGLAQQALDGFAVQFVEGMTTEHRSRLLGD